MGITIYKNIHKIARDNFNNILVKVKNGIQRWKNLKVSLQGRISTVKMNLLPQFFFFSMLPLSPPPGYFKEINSIISKFIWNDKCPRIKLTTLQHPNSAGGLAVPNFELYYWSFQLKGIVHFEIKIWYLSAYPKGIQDVGVFFSSVDPILMFLGQTVLVCQSYNGRYRSLSL